MTAGAASQILQSPVQGRVSRDGLSGISYTVFAG